MYVFYLLFRYSSSLLRVSISKSEVEVTIATGISTLLNLLIYSVREDYYTRTASDNDDTFSGYDLRANETVTREGEGEYSASLFSRKAVEVRIGGSPSGLAGVVTGSIKPGKLGSGEYSASLFSRKAVEVRSL
jgi:hypothetical protein